MAGFYPPPMPILARTSKIACMSLPDDPAALQRLLGPDLIA
jgi:hypothetical protein